MAEVTIRQWLRERKQELGWSTRMTCVPQSYEPGQEGQVDWYEAWEELAGEPRLLHVFSMRSVARGAAFDRAYRRALQQAFLEGHEHAFNYFQGVFRVLRYDNLKSAVKKILRGHCNGYLLGSDGDLDPAAAAGAVPDGAEFAQSVDHHTDPAPLAVAKPLLEHRDFIYREYLKFPAGFLSVKDRRARATTCMRDDQCARRRPERIMLLSAISPTVRSSLRQIPIGDLIEHDFI